MDKVVDKEVDKEPHRILGALSKAVKETNKEMGSRDHVHTGWCTGHNSHRRPCTKYRTIKYQSLVMPSQPRFPVASYVMCVQCVLCVEDSSMSDTVKKLEVNFFGDSKPIMSIFYYGCWWQEKI